MRDIKNNGYSVSDEIIEKLWKLKEGEKLDWEWKVLDGEMALLVKKTKYHQAEIF